MTALMWACEYKKPCTLLMEATKKAGALDLQVNVVWSVRCEGCGQIVGTGAGREGEDGREGHLRRALTYACKCIYRVTTHSLSLETTTRKCSRRCIMQAFTNMHMRTIHIQPWRAVIFIILYLAIR